MSSAEEMHRAKLAADIDKVLQGYKQHLLSPGDADVRPPIKFTVSCKSNTSVRRTLLFCPGHEAQVEEAWAVLHAAFPGEYTCSMETTVSRAEAVKLLDGMVCARNDDLRKTLRGDVTSQPDGERSPKRSRPTIVPASNQEVIDTPTEFKS